MNKCWHFRMDWMNTQDDKCDKATNRVGVEEQAVKDKNIHLTQKSEKWASDQLGKYFSHFSATEAHGLQKPSTKKQQSFETTNNMDEYSMTHNWDNFRTGIAYSDKACEHDLRFPKTIAKIRAMTPVRSKLESRTFLILSVGKKHVLEGYWRFHSKVKHIDFFYAFICWNNVKTMKHLAWKENKEIEEHCCILPIDFDG